MIEVRAGQDDEKRVLMAAETSGARFSWLLKADNKTTRQPTPITPNPRGL